MSHAARDPHLAKQRQRLRADRLKRRLTLASVLGFAAFFGLAAQHVVRASSSATRQAERGTAGSEVRPTTFFDQQEDGFAFGNTGSTFSSDPQPASPPVAQTSVS